MWEEGSKCGKRVAQTPSTLTHLALEPSAKAQRGEQHTVPQHDVQAGSKPLHVNALLLHQSTAQHNPVSQLLPQWFVEQV